jgi:hypothetical protein
LGHGHGPWRKFNAFNLIAMFNAVFNAFNLIATMWI